MITQPVTFNYIRSYLDRYRFLELYYRRSESTHKGKVVPARVETVVLFLPDVWSCIPTRLEWDGLLQNYGKQLERKLKAAVQQQQQQQQPQPQPESDDQAAATDEKASTSFF